MYPDERSLVKELKGKPFVLLGVNSDKDRKALRETIAKEKITWRSWWDEGRVDGPIHTTWQVTERPTIYLLDTKGVIRHKNIEPDEVRAAIEAMVKDATANDK